MSTEQQIRDAVERGFHKAWPHSHASDRLLECITSEVITCAGIARDNSQPDLFYEHLEIDTGNGAPPKQSLITRCLWFMRWRNVSLQRLAEFDQADALYDSCCSVIDGLSETKSDYNIGGVSIWRLVYDMHTYLTERRRALVKSFKQAGHDI